MGEGETGPRTVAGGLAGRLGIDRGSEMEDSFFRNWEKSKFPGAHWRKRPTKKILEHMQLLLLLLWFGKPVLATACTVTLYGWESEKQRGSCRR